LSRNSDQWSFWEKFLRKIGRFKILEVGKGYLNSIRKRYKIHLENKRI
jgi:hypothetical protein